jgi:hypothetical protein
MSKNLLQELCQSRKYGLPKYLSAMEGPSHAPVWTSLVEIQTPNHLFLFVGDDPFRTKKEAEESVARKALAGMEGEMSKPIRLLQSRRLLNVKELTALMVDVENLPKLISQLPKFDSRLHIYAFVGKHHPLASVDFEALGANKIISPSTRPDGTDTCMVMWVGAFLAKHKYDRYLIATRDHFGSAVVDLITEECECGAAQWGKLRATVVTTVEHIIEALR